MPIKLNTASGGGVILQGANTASDKNITIPADDGTMVYANSSGNVGIGTSSPTAKVQIGDATVVASNRIVFGKAQSSTEGFLPAIGHQSAGVGNDLAFAATSTSGVLRFFTGASSNSGEIGTGSNTERARIDSSGNLLVGTTGFSYNPSQGITLAAGSVGSIGINHANGTTSGNGYVNFVYNTTNIGSITQNGTTSVAYNTSSDYRLKENVQPMQGALAKVAALKPCTYTWKADGSAGEGFIAHELAEVVPDCVTGEKDAVDSDGNPIYQGIDTSFLVATLTAAIQELKAEVDSLRAQVEAK